MITEVNYILFLIGGIIGSYGALRFIYGMIKESWNCTDDWIM